MRKYLLPLLFCILVYSCGNSEKEARVYLETARNFYDNSDYTSAKLYLDSIKSLYPKELQIQQEGLFLMRHIELKEQERNLTYCDSMLILRKQEAETFKANFLFEKDSEYDELGKYFDKRQKLENNLQQSYIRSWTNEIGEIFLASVYYGSSALKHNQLKVSSSDGFSAETEVVPHDGGMNYSFTNLGMTTEVVTYTRQKENGVVAFINENKDKALKAEYLGGRKYSLTISSANKTALSNVFELSLILSDIENLKKEQEKSTQRIAYLRKKIETKASDVNED